MAYSYVAYTGNGATTQFALTFPYIRKEHVKVYVNYVDTAYTWLNDSTVQLASAPANGLRVEVRRLTPLNAPLVDYADGSTLVAADLDTANLQQLYLQQELDDDLQQTVSIDPATGLPSAGGQRITNVGTPTQSTDAATKTYVDSNVGAVSASAVAAAASATNAASSATSAASSAASALAAFDSFDDRYLGAKASDPTVDNDGDPLNAGDLYYNTTSSVMKVYTGSVWVIAYVPGDAVNISFTPYSTTGAANVQAAIQELTDEKLNLTGGTMTGSIAFNAGQTFPGVLATSGGTMTGSITFNAGQTFPGVLATSGGTVTGALEIGTAGSLVFEGSSADDNETTLAVTNPTADRTITLPDATGTAALLSLAQSFSAAQRGAISALTDGTTITADFALANNFSVTLGGNRTLANPSNLTAGQSGAIFISQDGTGSRTLAFGSYWDFSGGTAPTLTTTASAVDLLVYTVRSTTSIHAQLITNLS